ncbi:unnamed protein product [Darwinula stevensoni]|uniref:Phospholipid scramblase n=1 Tax=Darwinula stevensoni TaxID=69355 RepID=A0A7R9AFW4_9CRUS|nr:unnamed protein product [Darwinula stevensoni]CAG0903367.1 unnamed protein product [Darwinula stevensoni]
MTYLSGGIPVLPKGLTESKDEATDVPPGMDVLLDLTHVVVQQKIEWFQILTGCETRNQYWLKTTEGEELYHAKEDSNCCLRLGCGSLRPFTIALKNKNEQEVLRLERPLKCTGSCCPCCLQV